MRASLTPISQSNKTYQDNALSSVFGFRQAKVTRDGNSFYYSMERHHMLLHTVPEGGRTLESLLDQTCFNNDSHYFLFLTLPQVFHIRVNVSKFYIIEYTY
jgi:hypothetical protein